MAALCETFPQWFIRCYGDIIIDFELKRRDIIVGLLWET
jgi:hypothetical protein